MSSVLSDAAGSARSEGGSGAEASRNAGVATVAHDVQEATIETQPVAPSRNGCGHQQGGGSCAHFVPRLAAHDCRAPSRQTSPLDQLTSSSHTSPSGAANVFSTRAPIPCRENVPHRRSLFQSVLSGTPMVDVTWSVEVIAAVVQLSEALLLCAG